MSTRPVHKREVRRGGPSTARRPGFGDDGRFTPYPPEVAKARKEAALRALEELDAMDGPDPPGVDVDEAYRAMDARHPDRKPFGGLFDRGGPR